MQTWAGGVGWARRSRRGQNHPRSIPTLIRVCRTASAPHPRARPPFPSSVAVTTDSFPHSRISH